MNLLSLSQEEIQVILGGLLGDSYYNKSKKTIRFHHSQKQEKYLKWKYDFFNKNSNQICRKIYYGKRLINNNTYNYCNFEIYNKNDTLNDMYSFIQKHLYSNEGRKKISMKYLSELTPLGLAVWWMDDGAMCISKDNRYGKLSTQCFNYEENILLQKYFKKKWKIDVSIKCEKNKYYFLRFNVFAMKELIKIIYKYVCEVPSMIYKIDLKYTNKGCIKDFNDIYKYIEQHKE